MESHVAETSPPAFVSLENRVIEEIVRPLVSVGTRRVVPAETRVEFGPDSIWWVTSGTACLEYLGREIILLEPGSLVGTWHQTEGPMTLSTVGSDGCELVGFPPSKIVHAISQDAKKAKLWSAYQAALLAKFFSDFAELKARSVAPVPQYRHYARGETIILEGDEGEEVFVLTEGLAQVSVKGTAVGEIHQDEVFGALAALTESVRTATVIAAKPCDCMVFSKGEFRDLLRAHPDLMSKLFSDFARALHDLNDSVLRAHHTKWRNLF